MVLDGEGASSSTPPSSSSSPSVDPQAPSSSLKEAVSLNDWWLVKSEQDYHGLRLAVGGMQMKPQQATRVFCSSPIVKRHSTFILETADGATVIVQGLINKQRTLQNGFPAEAIEKFLMGFPYNWEAHASLYCGEGHGTHNAPRLSSFIVGLPVPSADLAGSVLMPMRRLLDYLISSRDLSNRSEFAKVHKNCASQALGNPTVMDLHTEAANNGRNEEQADCSGRNEDQAARSGRDEEQADCSGRNEEQGACSGRNGEQAACNGRKEACNGRNVELAACSGRNVEQAACNGRNEVQATYSPNEVNKQQAAFSKIKAVQSKKVCVSRESRSVTARRIICRPRCLEDNNESEQTPEESLYQRRKWAEPIEGLFSGEGHCSIVGKASRKLKKSNKSSPLLEEEMRTARYNLRNSGGRRSSCRIMKNLEEDQVIKGNLEIKQKVGSSMVENNDIVNNVRSTTETISHGIHMDGAEDALEEVMCAETPKNNDSVIIQSGYQVDEPYSLGTVCVQKESSISSIECGEAASGSTSNNSIFVHQSSDGVKASTGKIKKGTLVTQHRLMRSSAKKGVVLPESLSCKRSRSGRLLVPVLADWRNQQPVYDLDGGITGIAIGFNKKLPPKG